MKRFFSLLVLFVAVFVLASCGSEPVTIDNPVLELDDYTNLTANVSFWHAMGQENQAVIQILIEKFNETYPNITVTQHPQGGYDDLRDKITQMLKVGEGPTIAQTYPDHVSLYLASSSLKQLDPYLEHSKLGLSPARIADYVPSYYQEGRMYDSAKNLYSLPFNKSTEAFYINATWFEQHGLLAQYNLGEIQDITYGEGDEAYTVREFVPTDGAHLTWQDIEEIAAYYVTTPEYVNATAEERLLKAAVGIDSEANFFITSTYQFGGQYTGFDANGKGVILFGNDANSKAAMQWLVSGFNAGYYGTSQKFGTDYCSDAFKSQQIKMTIGSSAGARYNDPGTAFVYGVLPYPQQESSYNPDGSPNYAKQFVIQQGTNVSLFKRPTAAEETAGWLFMSYISNDPEAQYIWSRETAYVPSVKSVWDMEEYTNWIDGITVDNGKTIYSAPTINARTIMVAVQQQSAYYTNVAFKGTSKARDEITIIVNGILYGGKSIDDAYALAIEQINSSMGR